MKEYGGCRAWEFSDVHVAKRLVELGLEEYDPEEPSKRVRRARKPSARRTTSVGGPWNHPGGYHHQPHPQPIRTLTTEQEDHLIEQFCKPEPETPPPESADDHMMTGDDRHHHQQQENDAAARAAAENDPGRADSARVAKRACQQMFNKSTNPIYGAISSENRHPMP